METFESYAYKIKRWKKDPVLFVHEEFGVEPDEWQKDFLRNYIEGQRSGAKACKGPGKTAVLAWCAWHFLVCFKDCKIGATSITGDNLRDNLWAEMAKWQARGKVTKACFTWAAEKITNNDYPETWFMAARRWLRDATGDQQANALAGLHADNIMFIIDEAGGVPDAVMAAAEAVLANAGTDVNPNAVAKILICGNPTHLSGPLYRACTTEASLWKMIEITGDPDDPKRSPRISINWAREQIKKYGVDNPWVMVNVFGKFPPASINALLGPDEVLAAMTRSLRTEVWMNEVKVLGVDVALQGDDSTVITPRQGPVIFKQKVLRSPDPKFIAGVVANAIKKFNPDAVFIDNTGGWGSGVISHLRDWGYAVTGVQFSEKALDSNFFNKRTEIHHNLARFIKDGGCLPNEPELKEELCAQTYTHKGDKLLMTAKDQIKEELGRSPDRADSAALTFAFPVMKSNRREEQRQKADNEYNPLAALETASKEDVADYNPLQN